MAVLQCVLCAEVEIVGDERGGGDVLWSGIALLVTVAAGWHQRMVWLLTSHMPGWRTLEKTRPEPAGPMVIVKTLGTR